MAWSDHVTHPPLHSLGGGETDAEEVKNHVFFDSINWDDLYNCKVAPPFKPVVKSEQDVANFDKEFTDEVPELTPPDESMCCIPLSSPPSPLSPPSPSHPR